jgi:hypothetical protein
MKQIKKIAVLLLVVFVFSYTSNAQTGLVLNLDYNVSQPVGSSFRNYIDRTSFRGMQASLLYGLDNHFKVGLQTSFNDFYQKYDRQVYHYADGSDESAVISNSLQYTPVVAKAQYTILPYTFIRPYVGLGAGVNFINYNQYQGLYQYSKLYSRLAVTGDAGIDIPFSRYSNYAFHLGTSYNYSPLNAEGIKNLNTWSVQGGLIIPLR